MVVCMSSFRDRVIESVKNYYEEEYEEEIEASTKILEEAVELINLYINHQDKKYEKIFKEGVYCDLVYDEEISPFLPIAVLKSTKSESVELRITRIPLLSKTLIETDPENDDYNEAEDDIDYALGGFTAELDEDKIESIEEEIYSNVLDYAERDEYGDIIDEEEFDFSLSYAFDQFFDYQSNKKIADMFLEEQRVELVSNSTYSCIRNMMEAIETKNLYNEIFSIPELGRKEFDHEDFKNLQDTTSISKLIARIKYKKFIVSSTDISDDILEYILDTENILQCVSSRSNVNFPIVNINKNMFKGVVKNIHVLVLVD